MINGFIYLHRKIMEWEWYSDIKVCRLFIHLLLKANHENNEWQGIKILKGQLITGRLVLSKETGLSQREIRTCLTKLKTTNEVTIKTTNRFSLITLVNYGIYQNKRPAERPATRPTSDQQTTTNNKDNKNNIYIACKEYLEHFNLVWDSAYKNFKPLIDNMTFWLKIYSLEDIKQAVSNSLSDPFFKDAHKPELYLRTRNKNGECDYIGQLLNSPVKSSNLKKSVVITEKEEDEC